MSAAQEFHALAVMALADGHFAVQERDLLLRCAEWLGLPRREAAWIVTRVSRARRGPAVVVPVDPVVKERLFYGLINVAIADRIVTEEETRCLQSLAPSFGVDAARVPEILRRANEQEPAARDWPESWDAARPAAQPEGVERLQTGSTVGGKFVLRDLIGVGGFGRVFRAYHPELKEDVALKLLRVRFGCDERAEAMFRREVKAARSFLHRYAVPLREFGRDAETGALYFTMDLVEGYSLDTTLDREGKLAPQRAVRLCLQALEALEEAHEQGLIHRDLKPGNLMLATSRSGEEEIRIVDFGIARAVHVLESSEDPDQVETPIGTIGYMSPEQARCRRLEPSSDLYSMGVVLYELLSGRLPIVADPNTAHLRRSFLARILHAVPEPLDDHVPTPLRQVIDVVLRKDPADRFQSAAEFREALERATDPDRDTGRFSRWLTRR